MRRRLVVIPAVVVVVIAAGTATTLAVRRSHDQTATPAQPRPAATATVERGGLVDTQTVDGTLGYGDSWNLVNGVAGTVTWTRAEGAIVRRGQKLYKMDNDPVVLMYGTVPVYRTLSVGVSDGPDVEQLERNLRKLGYGNDLTVDDHFSDATADAVEDWQDDNGLPVTGGIDASQVVFAPGAVRVTDVTLQVGERAAPGEPALSVTSTQKQVKVSLDTADQDLARNGARATVELPDDDTVTGTISHVSKVAKAASGSGTSSSGTTDATIEVDITLTDPKQAGDYDQAPVSVDLVSARAKDVLSVPVQALIALPDGGYGVQVVNGGRVTTVPVKTGIYASSRVEISGDGITEGTTVGVPSQ